MRALTLLFDLWTCLTVLESFTMALTTNPHPSNNDNCLFHIQTFSGKSFKKVSLFDHGEFLCYPLTDGFSGCHDDSDMVCPESCGRRSRRSLSRSPIPKYKFAQSQSRIEAIYFRDMRVQGLSFSDPESWKERRRKRWKPKNRNTLNPTNAITREHAEDSRNFVKSQSLGKSQGK